MRDGDCAGTKTGQCRGKWSRREDEQRIDTAQRAQESGGEAGDVTKLSEYMFDWLYGGGHCWAREIFKLFFR